MESIFTSLLTECIDEFFVNLSFTINVDNETCCQVWNSVISNEREKKLEMFKKPVNEKKKRKKNAIGPDKMREYNPQYRYNCDELKILCRLKGYATSGKKQFLIDQLTGKVEPKISLRKGVKGDIKGLMVKGGKVKKKHIKKMFNKTVSNINRLKQGTIKFKVALNEQGNYQHIDSKLIVDIKNNMVIGSQTKTDVVALSLEEINICRRYNLQFEIPRTILSEENMKNKEIDENEELTVEDYADINELSDDDVEE